MVKKKFFTSESLSTLVDEIKAYVISAVSGKANSSHTHSISNISNLQSSLDAKVSTSRTVNGKALSSNITLSASDVGAATSTHTHDGYVNQNAFSNVKVGSTTVAADTTTDTLEIAAGTGISVSGDATNDKVTITNSGVRSVDTGSSNGTISVNTNGASADVAVKGLGSAAYTASTAYDAAGKADIAEANAKTYTDTKISDLINSAPTTLDTLGEIATAMEENADVVEALESAIGTKADKTHSHAIADVSGLQSALDGKAASSHGTHVSFDSTNKPKMDGTAAFGTSTKVARADHVHPTDTSRASKTEFDSHTADTTKHITSTERTNWNAAKTHADSAHVTGVKGNSESTYRTGNVNITPANIGAATTKHSHQAIHIVDAGAGTAGYNKIASFKVTSTYQNQVFELELVKRAANCTCKLYIKFSNDANTDPSSVLMYFTGENYGCYITKSAASTFDLYVARGGYDNIAVLNYSASSYSKINVTWTDVYVDKLPDSYVTATLTGNVNGANKLTSSAGSATQPVYFSAEGKPVATTYTLGKSVPSDAKFTDTVYTHPTTSGNKHIPSGGSSGQILRWSADGTAVWGNDNNTVYKHPTYTARTGKPTGNQTPAFGGTATVSQITSDGTGHVTGATDRTITIPSTLSNGTGTAGLIKTTSTVTSNSGYTACPVISGVPYYKDTNTIYTHPTTSGNKHIPSGGSSGQFLKWSANGTATWASVDLNVDYTKVTFDTTEIIT